MDTLQVALENGLKEAGVALLHIESRHFSPYGVPVLCSRQEAEAGMLRGIQPLLDLSATYNGRLPQAVLGEDARNGGAYDTIRSKLACTPRARWKPDVGASV